jgi:hypothetical protein
MRSHTYLSSTTLEQYPVPLMNWHLSSPSPDIPMNLYNPNYVLSGNSLLGTDEQKPGVEANITRIQRFGDTSTEDGLGRSKVPKVHPIMLNRQKNEKPYLLRTPQI